MASMICTCGNRMSNVCCPNTLEGEIKGLYEYKTRNVWECPECGRLWIDTDDPEIKGCHIPKSYLPENKNSEGLFDIGSSEQFLRYLEDFWKRHQNSLKKLGIVEDKEKILNDCIIEQQKRIHDLEARLIQL